MSQVTIDPCFQGLMGRSLKSLDIQVVKHEQCPLKARDVGALITNAPFGKALTTSKEIRTDKIRDVGSLVRAVLVATASFR